MIPQPNHHPTGFRSSFLLFINKVTFPFALSFTIIDPRRVPLSVESDAMPVDNRRNRLGTAVAGRRAMVASWKQIEVTAT